MSGNLIKVVKKRRSLKSLLIGQVACILLIFLIVNLFLVIRWEARKIMRSQSFSFSSSPLATEIKIGMVVCTGPTANLTENSGPIEAYTLIKSAIISAQLYNQVKELEFQIFVDNDLVESFLESEIYNMIPKTGGIRVYHSIHNVFKSSLTVEHVDKFIKTSKSPGAFLRIFFPQLLPTLDKILYLDTDVVITGNIAEIWRSFLQFNSKTLVGLAPNNEIEDGNHLIIDSYNFGDIPHVTPKGLNSGVMYMNLDGMRKANWTSTLLLVYDGIDKRGIRVSDQRLINVLLHFQPDDLELLPCHYNFQYLHCDRGLTCKEALEDQTGIQIFHGTGDSFHKPQRSHHLIFKAYAEFDLASISNLNQVFEGLLKPLKQTYTEVNSWATCNGTLGPLLFKDLL